VAGGIADLVREAASKRLLFLPHAIRAMARPTPLLLRAEVESAVRDGELVEDYPEDVRGHGCLMLHSPQGRPVHLVCSPKVEYLAIITAYVPDPASWSTDFKRRKP